MADVTGVRTTGNENQAQRRIDIQEEILLLEPSSTPLTRLSNLLSSKSSTDPKFTWFEDSSLVRTLLINNGAGYTTTATTLVVDTPGTQNLQVNDIVKVTRTGEIMHVASITNSTTVVVERAPDNAGTGVAINDNDELVIIGSAFNENSLSRAPISNNPAQKVNYTQIFRDSTGASRTLMQSSQYTNPNDWVYQNQKTAIEHNKQKEYSFWFGKASENLSYTGGPLRTTDGVLNRISTNVTAVGGALTESTWRTILRTGSRFMSDSRILFAAGLPISALQGFAFGKIQIVDQAKKDYGLDVQRFYTFFGTVDIIWEKLFDDTAGYNGIMVGLDAKGLKYRYLANENGSSDTHVLTNRQEPNRDGRIDEILSECGIQVPEEKKMFYASGITG